MSTTTPADQPSTASARNAAEALATSVAATSGELASATAT